MTTKISGEVLDRDVAVPRVKARLPGNAIYSDVTVAGVQIECDERRHLDLDTHALMHAEMDPPLIRDMDLEVDPVSVLPLRHSNARVSDGVALCDDVSRNRITGATRHLD